MMNVKCRMIKKRQNFHFVALWLCGSFFSLCIFVLILLLPAGPALAENDFQPPLLFTIEGFEGTGPFQKIHSMSIDEGRDRILVLSGEPLKISVFSLMDGSPLQEISIFGELDPPYTVFASGKHIYFTSASGSQRFTEDGLKDTKYSAAALPSGVDKSVCGRMGEVFLLLREANTVEKLAKDGKPVFTFNPGDEERLLDGEPKIKSINDMAADAGGGLYVAAKGHNSIYKYDEKGEYVSAIGGGDKPGVKRIESPGLVAVDFRRNVWVHDETDRAIKVFDSFGFFLGEWLPGVEHDFIAPAALAVDRFDRLYLFDSGRERIDVYNIRNLF